LNTLHSLHIFFTDDLTFMASSRSKNLSSLALASESDPPSGQIIGGEFYRHPISRQYLNEMHSHFAGYMSQHPVAVIELNAKHGVRQGLDDCTFYLYRLFFRHKSLSFLNGKTPLLLRVITSFLAAA
jgi:hypothetical protein